MTATLPAPDATGNLSVLIIEDHPVMRLGLECLINLESDISICGSHSTSSGAVDLALSTDPDVIILDLTLPDGSGYSLIHDFKKAGIRAPILIVSMHPESGFADRALLAGAKGYVTKDSAPDNIVKAIRRVATGEIFVSDTFAQEMVQRLSKTGSGEPFASVKSLSDREFEIFELVGRGIPSKEIAKRLGISPKTVEVHRSNIRSKLQIASGPELIRFAIRWFEFHDDPLADPS